MIATMSSPEVSCIGQILASKYPLFGHFNFLRSDMAKAFFKGHFLVARPELTDSNFGRAVVYLFDHSPEGAAGVVINKPSKLTMDELSTKIFGKTVDWDKPIMVGGPVGGPLLVVHRDADWADEEVQDEVFRTVDPDKIHHILERRLEPSLLIANYAGWGPNQLEKEIEEGSWEIIESKPDQVFWNEIKDLWDVLMGEIHSRNLAQVLKMKRVNDNPGLN